MEDWSRSSEFQDSASAEKSGFVDLQLLPAGALKWHFSGILRFSNSIIFSLPGPHNVKRLWALEGSRLELKMSKTNCNSQNVKIRRHVSDLGPA